MRQAQLTHARNPDTLKERKMNDKRKKILIAKNRRKGRREAKMNNSEKIYLEVRVLVAKKN